MSDKLLATAQYAVEKGLQRGADEVEAYASAGTLAEATAENNTLHTASKVIEGGLGIRVVKDGRVGFSYTNSLRNTDVLRAVETAIGVARHTPRDPWWPGLPGKFNRYPKVGGLYSSKLASLSIEKVVECIKEIITLATSRKGLTVVYAGAAVSSGAEVLVNSNGIEVFEEGTLASLSLELVAEDSPITPPAYCFEGSRTEVPDIISITEECIDKALKSVKPISTEGDRYEVLFSPYALDSLIGYALAPALLGDNVVRGKSPLAGSVGELIASPDITIVDDGTIEGGLGSSSFDGEGVPTKRNELIVKGVLKEFVYDSYWGKRGGKESTGNAVRPTYSTLPRVGFNNLIITAGSGSVKSYLSSSEKLLVVDGVRGAHTSVPETGEFSVVAAPTWLVSKDEFKAVKGIAIAGNIWDLIKSTEFISKEVKSVGSFILPWISFSKVTVISKY